MKTKFGLVFSVREDGTKTWAAECQRCGELLVGERYPQVTVLRVSQDMPPSQFEQVKRMAAAAWDTARRNGHPVVIGDPRIEVSSTLDHGDLQRSLEAHAESCQPPWYVRPAPTSLPGPGEPR